MTDDGVNEKDYIEMLQDSLQNSDQMSFKETVNHCKALLEAQMDKISKHKVLFVLTV